MLEEIRQIIRELLDAIQKSEHDGRFYSRAVGWTIAVLLLAGILLGFTATSGDPPRYPECRVAAQGKPITAQPLVLELARGPTALAGLLAANHPVPPTLDTAVCSEERVARYRDALGLDSALFIPLYIVLGTLVLGWMLVVRMGVDKNDQQHFPELRRVLALALVPTAVMLVTAYLDVAENEAAQHVLDLAVGQGALLNDASTHLAAAINATRHSSLLKWLAAGVWMATFAGMAWWLKPALALATGKLDGRRWPKLLSTLLVVIGFLAALTLLAGAVLGWVGPASADKWVRSLLLAGFGLFFAFPCLVLVLQFSPAMIHRLQANP